MRPLHPPTLRLLCAKISRNVPFRGLKKNGRSIFIAIGKAAPAMMNEALRHAEGDYGALVVTHSENQTEVPGAKVLRAAHPIPDERGLLAGREIVSLLNGAGAQD